MNCRQLRCRFSLLGCLLVPAILAGIGGCQLFSGFTSSPGEKTAQADQGPGEAEALDSPLVTDAPGGGVVVRPAGGPTSVPASPAVAASNKDSSPSKPNKEDSQEQEPSWMASFFSRLNPANWDFGGEDFDPDQQELSDTAGSMRSRGPSRPSYATTRRAQQIEKNLGVSH